MNETGIAKREETGIIPVTPDTIKRYINRHATDQEIALFLNQCKLFEVNPFKDEIYLIKYKADEPAKFVFNYNVYFKRASRSSVWDGMESSTAGSIGEGDLTATAIVYRKDMGHPVKVTVDYSEYVQTTREGQPTRFWATKPKTMLKKVAESQAMRKAFPDELGGTYTVEERNDVDMQRLPDALHREAEESEETKEKEAQALAESDARHKEFEDKPATDAQASEIDRLVATLVDKHSSDPGQILLAIRDKFGVEVLKDATEDQAATIILYLTGAIKAKDNKMKAAKA